MVTRASRTWASRTPRVHSRMMVDYARRLERGGSCVRTQPHQMDVALHADNFQQSIVHGGWLARLRAALSAVLLRMSEADCLELLGGQIREGVRLGAFAPVARTHALPRCIGAKRRSPQVASSCIGGEVQEHDRMDALRQRELHPAGAVLSTGHLSAPQPPSGGITTPSARAHRTSTRSGTGCASQHMQFLAPHRPILAPPVAESAAVRRASLSHQSMLQQRQQYTQRLVSR
jgi:hypothetical protein